jgi:hypothetical protein
MKRLFLVLVSMCVLAVTAHAQVQLVPFVRSQWLDSNGKPLAGACIFSTVSGTSTPLATYTDYTGTVLNPNPVVLDSAGRGDIWLSGQAYRLRLVTAGGVNCSSGSQVWQEDGINSSVTQLLSTNNIFSGSNTFTGTSIFNGPTTFSLGFTSNGPSNLTLGGSLAGTFSGSPIFSGSPNFSAGFTSTTGNFSDQIRSPRPWQRERRHLSLPAPHRYPT